MIKTYGITHLAIYVSDFDRSIRFYHEVFGMKVTFRHEDFVQMETPGRHDVLVMQRKERISGRTGDLIHFGFRLPDIRQVNEIAATVERAGGTIVRSGEFGPGVPYFYVADPNGYEIEIWYES